MRKVIASLCMMMMSIYCFGQTTKNVLYDCVMNDIKYQDPVEQKKTVGQNVASVAGAVLSAVAGVSNVTKDEPAYAQSVRDAVVAGISATYRLKVVDGAPSGNRPVLAITGTISSIKSTSRVHTWTDNDKKTHTENQYKGTITGNITLTDTQSGNVIGNIDISYQSYDYGWFSSADLALNDAVSNVKSLVYNQVNKMFPLYANIVEGASAKKDRQKEVYIDLGEPYGVYKGLQFYVYQVNQVAGKEAKKEIGRLKVTEVQGDDISLCKVMRGGKDIKAAMDAGTELQIMSK